jgi:hypothetical protein
VRRLLLHAAARCELLLDSLEKTPAYSGVGHMAARMNTALLGWAEICCCWPHRLSTE